MPETSEMLEAAERMRRAADGMEEAARLMSGGLAEFTRVMERMTPALERVFVGEDDDEVVK